MPPAPPAASPRPAEPIRATAPAIEPTVAATQRSAPQSSRATEAAAAAPQAAPEFAPIFTFESPESSPAVDLFGGDDAAPKSWPGRVPEPLATTDPRLAQANGVDATPLSPANSDWLAEVHASLTKLSTQPEPSGPDMSAIGSAADYAAADDIRQRQGNTVAGRVVMVASILVIAIVVAVAALILLPPELRPFELPPEILSFINGASYSPPQQPTNSP